MPLDERMAIAINTYERADQRVKDWLMLNALHLNDQQREEVVAELTNRAGELALLLETLEDMR